MPHQKRKDYLRNARKPHEKQSGCMWCGVPVDHVSGYCSDVCLQLDMEGIDDRPPAMILQPGNGPNSTYIARKFAEYNKDYGRPAEGS